MSARGVAMIGCRQGDRRCISWILPLPLGQSTKHNQSACSDDTRLGVVRRRPKVDMLTEHGREGKLLLE